MQHSGGLCPLAGGLHYWKSQPRRLILRRGQIDYGKRTEASEEGQEAWNRQEASEDHDSDEVQRADAPSSYRHELNWILPVWPAARLGDCSSSNPRGPTSQERRPSFLSKRPALGLQFIDFTRMDEKAACLPGGLFHFEAQTFAVAYQACERNHRHAPRPACHATGRLFQEIFAVPVMPSRSDPSVLGNAMTTAK